MADFPIRTAILQDMQTAGLRRERYRAGRAKCKQQTGSTSDACGCVLAQYVCGRILSAYKAGYARAQTIADALEADPRVVRISWKELAPGDIAVCDDVHPKNGLSDHVWLCYGPTRNGKAAGPGCMWAVDNQRADPYIRDVRRPGGKTDTAYGLRIGA